MQNSLLGDIVPRRGNRMSVHLSLGPLHIKYVQHRIQYTQTQSGRIVDRLGLLIPIFYFLCHSFWRFQCFCSRCGRKISNSSKISEKDIKKQFFALFPMAQSASCYDAQEQSYIGFLCCIPKKSYCTLGYLYLLV